MKYRKKPVVVEATQWFKNGDHPLDYKEPTTGFENGELREFSGDYRRGRGWEGSIVRYFRRPDVSGQETCRHCCSVMHIHGWIDTLEGGQRPIAISERCSNEAQAGEAGADDKNADCSSPGGLSSSSLRR